MKKEIFNIVVAFDSNYKMLAETMLVSLLKNNKYDMNIYLLYSHLEDEELKEVEKIIEKNTIKNKSIIVNFIPIYVNKNRYRKFFTTKKFPIEACYRLIMQDVLPKNIKKVMWLDADLIIKGSIYDFYRQPFGENYIIACEDVPNFERIVNPNIKRLGLPKESIYFNSGVMVWDLEKIRKEININEYFEVMENYKERLRYPDQDVINIVFNGKIKHNWCLNYNSYVSSRHIYTDKKDKKKVKSNAVIYHYIAKENKPTNYKFNNYCFDEFWKYGKYTYGYKKYISMKLKNKVYRLFLKKENNSNK